MSERERCALRLAHIGVIFQDHNLIAEFTGSENVALPLVARGTTLRAARRTASEVMAELGIGELVDRLPNKMSGGQRQRVGIARALAGGQKAMVADEPTGSLDRHNSTSLFAMLQAIAHDHGVAVLVATHDAQCQEFSDQVATMTDGRLS